MPIWMTCKAGFRRSRAVTKAESGWTGCVVAHGATSGGAAAATIPHCGSRQSLRQRLLCGCTSGGAEQRSLPSRMPTAHTQIDPEDNRTCCRCPKQALLTLLRCVNWARQRPFGMLRGGGGRQVGHVYVKPCSNAGQGELCGVTAGQQQHVAAGQRLRCGHPSPALPVQPVQLSSGNSSPLHSPELHSFIHLLHSLTSFNLTDTRP